MPVWAGVDPVWPGAVALPPAEEEAGFDDEEPDAGGAPDPAAEFELELDCPVADGDGAVPLLCPGGALVWPGGTLGELPGVEEV